MRETTTPAGERPVALGSRFRRLWAGTVVANFGDGILVVGFPLLAVGLTRSPLLVSLVSTFATLPWLLVALHAGALADRYDRRRIVLAAAWFRAGALALLAVLGALGSVRLPAVYVAVLALGIAEVFADTTAQSMLPMVVDRSRLGAANGRVIAAQRIANDFMGGPAAGALVAAGAAAFFAAPALLYVTAALLMLSLRGRYRVDRPSTTRLRTDIAEGIRYLARHRVLRSLAVLAGLLNFTTTGYLAVFVLWAVGEESTMQLGPQTYGLLFAAVAVGGVTGALLVEPLSRVLGEIRVLLGGAVFSSALLLAPVAFPVLHVALPTFFAVGLSGAMTNVAIVSVRQRLIPDDLLGRVNATYRLIGMGTMPFGAAFGGVVASVAGLVTVFVSVVCIALGAVLYATRHVSEARVRALGREDGR